MAQFCGISCACKIQVQSETASIGATKARGEAAVSGAKILTAVEEWGFGSQPNPSSARWSAQANGRSMSCRVRAVSEAGCRPLTMAVTISGARQPIAASLPSRVRHRPLLAAMVAMD